MEIDRATNEHVRDLACVECLDVSTTARGWKAYRFDDPETDEPPRLTALRRASGNGSSSPQW